MVKRCVAATCSKTYADNVSLFQFPRDLALKRQWTKQVQRTRAKWSGPSEYVWVYGNEINEMKSQIVLNHAISVIS